MSLTERQNRLIEAIIDYYAPTAEPVPSSVLVRKYKLPYSSATIRNEMAELEHEGYLNQPHTSAGRVPTEKAYAYYTEVLLDEAFPFATKMSEIQPLDVVKRDQLHASAEVIAKIVQRAVVIATEDGRMTFAGMRQLLSQPEFHEVDVLRSLGAALDHMEDGTQSLWQRAQRTDDDVLFAIGSKNPFHPMLSSISVQVDSQHPTLLVVLSPMRIHYASVAGYLRNVRDMID